MLLDVLLFLVGVGLLMVGAWLLVEGGSRIAAVLGVPPVVVGLTVVAFGTSAPELFVSLAGALQGSTGLVLGNVIGSNVANIGLILGAAAVLRPVIVERGLVRREVPLLTGATVLFCVLTYDGAVSRFDGLLLLVAFTSFIAMTLRDKERGSPVLPKSGDLPRPSRGHRLRALLAGSGLALLGVGGLAGGGNLIVGSALHMARALGVSETVIGLSLVAVGTSLPELATTLMAAWRDQDDMALGNIVGSNLFNLLGVAGPVALIRPLSADSGGLTYQLGAMLVLTIMMHVMIVARGGSVGRTRGVMLLIVYGAVVTAWVVL